MSENLRKLVSVRRITAINDIPGADLIKVATIGGGWPVVVKANEFKAGDLCAYFEIDSFLPESDERYAFLMKSTREFEGVRGHKLRTIKLRGQVSQGLALPLHMFFADFEGSKFDEGQELSEFFTEGQELTELLGIKKWEATLPAELAGQAEGLFPSFIRKTDQERCQNLVPEIFGYEDTHVPFTAENIPQEAIDAMIAKGELTYIDGVLHKVYKAKGDPNARYEVTLKCDGSSMTVFARNEIQEDVSLGQMNSGVCSRNLQLKINAANAENSYVKLALQSGLLGILEHFARDGKGNFAVQGELMGPGIQGNREGLTSTRFYVFDVQNLDEGRYLNPEERREFMQALYGAGVNPDLVDHVPVLQFNVTLDQLGIHNVTDLLKYAEGPSITNKVREGLVFKRMDAKWSFKAISNLFLMGEKE